MMTLQELKSKKIDRMKSIANLTKLAQEALKIEYIPGDRVNGDVHGILTNIELQFKKLGAEIPNEIKQAQNKLWEDYRKAREASCRELNNKILAEAAPELKKKGLITEYKFEMTVTAKIPGKRSRVYGYFILNGMHGPSIIEYKSMSNDAQIYRLNGRVPSITDWFNPGEFATNFIDLVKRYNIKAA